MFRELCTYDDNNIYTDGALNILICVGLAQACLNYTFVGTRLYFMECCHNEIYAFEVMCNAHNFSMHRFANTPNDTHTRRAIAENTHTIDTLIV